MAVLDRIPEVIGELQSFAFYVPLTIFDTALETIRIPLLSEIVSIELSVGLVEGAALTPITAWVQGGGTWAEGSEELKNVDIRNVGRGTYYETTGRLWVTLHAGDNPVVATTTAPGMTEMHEALIVTQYNGVVDQFPKQVQFRVKNLNLVPREV